VRFARINKVEQGLARVRTGRAPARRAPVSTIGRSAPTVELSSIPGYFQFLREVDLACEIALETSRQHALKL